MKRRPPACSTAMGTVTRAALASSAPMPLSTRTPRPDQSIACTAASEADRKALGEAGQIGAEPAGDEEVVRIFHAREIVQAHLPERAARHEPVHGGDALVPRGPSGGRASPAGGPRPPAAARVMARSASAKARSKAALSCGRPRPAPRRIDGPRRAPGAGARHVRARAARAD